MRYSLLCMWLFVVRCALGQALEIPLSYSDSIRAADRAKVRSGIGMVLSTAKDSLGNTFYWNSDVQNGAQYAVITLFGTYITVTGPGIAFHVRNAAALDSVLAGRRGFFGNALIDIVDDGAPMESLNGKLCLCIKDSVEAALSRIGYDYPGFSIMIHDEPIRRDYGFRLRSSMIRDAPLPKGYEYPKFADTPIPKKSE